MMTFQTKRAIWCHSSSTAYLGLHVKCPIFLSTILTKFGVSQKIFIKASNIDLHGNPTRGSRVAIRRRIYVMRLRGVFRDWWECALKTLTQCVFIRMSTR
jgi:hypothetical protein